MTKSNRDAAKGEMGGNVLDEAMARSEVASKYRWVPRPPETHEVIAAQPGYLLAGCFHAPSEDDGDVLTIETPKASACSSCGTAIGEWDYQTLRNDADGSVARLCAPPNPIADMKAVANAAHWNGLPRPTWNGLPFPEVPVKFRAEEATEQPQIERIHGTADELRGLAAIVRRAATTGVEGSLFGDSPVRVYRGHEPLHVVADGPVLYIAGTATDLDSLAATIDHAANNGGATFLPVIGCGVSITREDAPKRTVYDHAAKRCADVALWPRVNPADIVTAAPPQTARAPMMFDRVRAVDEGLPLPGSRQAKVGAVETRVVPPPQPTPAPWQVWAPPDSACPKGWLDADGTLTVREVDVDTVRFRDSACASLGFMKRPGSGWRCLGVETPHGRVMVGDEFDGTPGLTVTEVVAGQILELRGSDGWETNAEASEVMAGRKWGRRTRYAPARDGELYRERETDEIAIIKKGMCGLYGHREPNGPDFALDREPGNSPKRWLDPRKWERLDPGRDESDESLRARLAERFSAQRREPTHPTMGFTLHGRRVEVPVIATATPGVYEASLEAALGAMQAGASAVMPRGVQFEYVSPRPRTLATPGGIPATPPGPTEAERIATALLDRRCLDLGTPRRDGESDDTLTARLDGVEATRLLDTAAQKGAPWLAAVGYAREGRHVALPDARAFVEALDVLVSARDVDAAVETFRRARMATGPTWTRGALERAARELTGEPARVVAVMPRVPTTRWEDPLAWQSATHFWERGSR